MSARAQKEKISKLSIKDKKLTRLFHNKNMNKKDSYFLNYMYEEKQNLNFFYGIGLNGLLCVLLNYALFRNNRKFLQLTFVGCTFLASHLYVRKQLEKRYNKMMEPYFEKYQIK
jgi:hypothetical protein